MRKKYLSALLFGALLFASAGTFTSCKDYDDDINNLQEQINTIASSLNDLKTKVESMGGVKDVTFADGVLTVTTDAGSATYTIPDKVGITKVELKDGVLYVDGVEAGKAQTVEVKDGILYIDGEAQELNVNFDSNVVAVIDKAAGIYTLTVNNETIELPIAFANVKITVVDGTSNKGYYYFTDAKYAKEGTYLENKQEEGIHWARATKDFVWEGGTKTAPKTGELVVGQITAAEVSVRPINYDLKANEDKLTLVSSTGAVAPVKINVYESQDNGPLNSGANSRAANIQYNQVEQGDYVLGITLNSDLTDEQVISAFASADQNSNIRYALALDGVIVTDYSFIIDTQLKADARPSCENPEADKFVIGGKDAENAPLGTHQMTYLDGRIYDMKVAINASDVADAEVYGVSVDSEKGTITAGANAVNRPFKLDVTLIDVNGNISETKTITVMFTETVAQDVTLSPVTYNVTPAKDKSLLVDVGNVFSSLSASEAISINKLDNIKWQVEDDDATFLWGVDDFKNLNGNTGLIKYYDKDMNDIDMSDDKIDEAVRSIRYVKFIIDDDKYPNLGAKRGEHLISVTINRNISASDNNSATKLIKKVNIPVHVVRPDWEDVFVKNGEWNGDKFVTRIVATNAYDYAEISMNAFDEIKGSEWDGAADGIYLTKLVYTADGNNDVPVAKDGEDLKNITGEAVKLDYSTLTQDIANTKKLAYNTMHTVAAYKIGDVEDFTITEEFDVQLQSIFEGTTLMYGDKSVATLNAANYTIDGSKLVLKLKGNSVNVTTNAFSEGIKAPYYMEDGKFILKNSLPIMANDIRYAASADASGLVGAGAKVTETGVQITKTSGQVNNGGTFTLTFTDIMGVQTTTSINFELSK
jgi:hypothetical protein